MKETPSFKTSRDLTRFVWSLAIGLEMERVRGYSQKFWSEFIPSHFIQGLKFGTYFAKILLKTYILPLLPSFHLTNSNWKRKLWINQSYNIWSKPKKSLNLMKKWGKYWKVFNDKYMYDNGWYYLTPIHLHFQNFI